MTIRFPAALLLAPLLFAAGPAQAAESYDSCTGFIDSLPAVVSTQGTWCLRKDLATALVNGNAITINANNVTLDCNRFKLGGLAAGPGTNAMGVSALDRVNLTVRNCNLRGFFIGVYTWGDASAGHVIEDNVFDGMVARGISVGGDGSVVRRNRVLDTGGSTVNPGFGFGIATVGAVEVSDNVVAGIAPLEMEGGVASAYGIYLGNSRGVPIRGNQVRDLAGGSNGGSVFGVSMYGSQSVDVHDNLLVGPFTFGVNCNDASNFARGNLITQATVLAVNGCTSIGNLP